MTRGAVCTRSSGEPRRGQHEQEEACPLQSGTLVVAIPSRWDQQVGVIDPQGQRASVARASAKREIGQTSMPSVVVKDLSPP